MAPRTADRVKILYVMDALRFGDGAGGTERQFLELLTHIDRTRFEPQLAVFRHDGTTSPAGAVPCPVHVLNIDRLRHPNAIVRLTRLAALIRRSGIRIVHIFFTDASIAAPLFCRMGGAAVVGSRRDMGFWYSAASVRALRISNRFVRRLIANSDAVRRNVHTVERYPLDRIEVVYNGHDPRRFEVPPAEHLRERLNIGPADPIVGMVANFNPWKRHVDLLRAFAIVRQRHPRAHLLLVGAGDEAPSRRVVSQLGLESHVHFLGSVTDPIPVIRIFSVGVLCSESEGSSNAVIEYLGCGKPVVCTNVGGNGELVEHDRTGVLLAPRDVDALAAGITALLDRPELRRAVVERAQAVARRLTVTHMVQQHMNLYERLAS